jgi:predicted transcriptional regulator
MKRANPSELSRRQRQIMHVVYTLGEATAAQVREGLPAPPSYSAVRALLAILVREGRLKFRRQQGRYVYRPVRSRTPEGRSALARVLTTFFEGSLEKAVASLLRSSDTRVSQDELDRLRRLIDQARREGR